jgi:polysaccharide biosynthesis/export protein
MAIFRSLKIMPIIAVTVLVWFASPGCGAPVNEYRLGPEDVVSVTVLRHPEISVDQIIITSDGKMQLPIAGSIDVGGKSISEAQALIAAALKNRLNNPEVTVALKQARTDRVFVIGSVAKPGVYDLKPGWRVTEALAAAGGFTSKPEMIAGSIFRLNKETLALEVVKLLTDGNATANLALMAGDVLSFTEKTVRVSVAGQVQRPGLYDVPQGAGVVEALAIAGGVAPRAALSKVEIRRASGEVVPADMFKAMVLGEAGANQSVGSGDLIIVPESKAKIAVLGAVNRPGQYDIEDGSSVRVSTAIALAGGPQDRARIKEVAVISTEKGQPKRTLVDLNRILQSGKLNEDLVLKDGDIVFVSRSGMDWDIITKSLTSLGALRLLAP